MGIAARRRFDRAAAVNVIGNAAKIVVEAAIGLTFGSVALLADAAHSVADLVASIVVFRWGGASYTGADPEHPHGHHRFEPVTAVVVGGAIGLMGIILLTESAEGILVGPTVRFHPTLVVGLAFAMADMGVVYWYTVRINKLRTSTALHA